LLHVRVENGTDNYLWVNSQAKAQKENSLSMGAHRTDERKILLNPPILQGCNFVQKLKYGLQNSTSGGAMGQLT
jgi:hypothetical protein